MTGESPFGAESGGMCVGRAHSAVNRIFAAFIRANVIGFPQKRSQSLGPEWRGGTFGRKQTRHTAKCGKRSALQFSHASIRKVVPVGFFFTALKVQQINFQFYFAEQALSRLCTRVNASHTRYVFISKWLELQALPVIVQEPDVSVPAGALS